MPCDSRVEKLTDFADTSESTGPLSKCPTCGGPTEAQAGPEGGIVLIPVFGDRRSTAEADQLWMRLSGANHRINGLRAKILELEAEIQVLKSQ